MKSDLYAPVFVSVYDRPYHFKQCIESLAKNPGAERTTLFISSDGPRDDGTRSRVENVREYIKTIAGFQRVVPVLAAENTRGAIKRQTRELVSESFDRMIRSEDDVVFSPYFLQFINAGLEAYEDEPKVWGICGHLKLGAPRKPDVGHVFLQSHEPWGYGVWRDRDWPIDFDSRSFARAVIMDKQLAKNVNAKMPGCICLLVSTIAGRRSFGDACRNASLVQHGAIQVFPTRNLTTHIGADGSGMGAGNVRPHLANVRPHLAKQQVCLEPVPLVRTEQIAVDASIQQWVYQRWGGDWVAFRNGFLLLQLQTQDERLRWLARFMYQVLGLPGQAVRSLGLRRKAALA